MNSWTFYVVKMKTKTNKTLFLVADVGDSCKWEFSKKNAIYFETEEQAEKFAKIYFKNFKNWYIDTICEKI